MVVVPSGAIEMKTWGLFTVPCGMPSAPYFLASSAMRPPSGTNCAASTSPPTDAMPFSMLRRLTFSMRVMEVVISRSLGSLLDGGADALIGSATADIACHGVVDVVVRRVRRLLQERRRLHDLAGLAIAALRHIQVAPRLLHRMIAVGRQAFDGRHGFAGDLLEGRRARARRIAVHM